MDYIIVLPISDDNGIFLENINIAKLACYVSFNRRYILYIFGVPIHKKVICAVLYNKIYIFLNSKILLSFVITCEFIKHGANKKNQIIYDYPKFRRVRSTL